MNHTAFRTPLTSHSVPLLDHLLSFFATALTASPQANASGVRRGRPVQLQEAHLLLACVRNVLSGTFTLKDLWLTLTLDTIGSFAPLPDFTQEGVRKRLRTLKLTPFRHLLRQVQKALLSQPCSTPACELASFAPAVVALDESKLDAVARLCDEVAHLPTGDPRLLAGKLVGLFDIRTQQWQRLHFFSDVLATSTLADLILLEDLPKGSLILADLGFFSFAWFQYLTEQGYVWVSRLKDRTSYEVCHVFFQEGDTLDALVWLGTYRSDHHPYMVRLIQFRQGDRLFGYLTNVTEPLRLPLGEIVQLYARRWDIELAFKLVTHLLGLRVWWACEPRLVLQQLFLTLTIAQVLHHLHMSVAEAAQVDPFEVSLARLIQILPRATWPCPQGLVATLLAHAPRLRLIRPHTRFYPCAPYIPPEHILPYPPAMLFTRPERHTVRKQPRHPRKFSPFDFRVYPLQIL